MARAMAGARGLRPKSAMKPMKSTYWIHQSQTARLGLGLGFFWEVDQPVGLRRTEPLRFGGVRVPGSVITNLRRYNSR